MKRVILCLVTATAFHLATASTPQETLDTSFSEIELPMTGNSGQVLTVSSCSDGVALVASWIWNGDKETGSWQLLSTTSENYNAGSDPGRSTNAEVPSTLCVAEPSFDIDDIERTTGTLQDRPTRTN